MPTASLQVLCVFHNRLGLIVNPDCAVQAITVACRALMPKSQSWHWTHPPNIVT
jgi:hypothetical protein